MADVDAGLTMEVWTVDLGDDGKISYGDEASALRRAQGRPVEHAKYSILPIGTRVRDVRHPEIVGRIRGYEWKSPGSLSLIPYNVEWDDDRRAHETLGWMWIYATPGQIEEVVDDG